MPTVKEKLDDIRSILEEVETENFGMLGWFSCKNSSCIKTNNFKSLEAFHSCGNSACIGGYIALSNMWRKSGGTISSDSLSFSSFRFRPVMGDLIGVDCLAKWFEIPEWLACVIFAGRYLDDNNDNNDLIVANWASWEPKDAIEALNIMEEVINSGRRHTMTYKKTITKKLSLIYQD